VPQLKGATKYLRTRQAVEFVLEKANAVSSDSTLNGREIAERVQEFFPDSDLLESSTRQYLSRCVEDPNSRVYKEPGKIGYFLTSVEALPDVVSEEDEQEAGERRQRELLLYPVLEAWLQEQGYRSKDVSTSRSNGQWGNPDVVGIRVTEWLTQVSVEVASVEAKTSFRDWRKWIFEAVAHRRFANRSYFAFAHPSSLLEKIDPDLRHYSELFRVGVLVVGLAEDRYKQLLSGALADPLERDEVELVERFGAPRDNVSAEHQRAFCEGIGIDSLEAAFRWGTSPPGA